jgi:hypothetical protein
MPLRAWAEFLDVYYRPHLVVVSLNAPTHSASGKKAVNLLQRLVEDLRSTADFALHPEEQEVKVAFESDLDAEAARGLLRADVVEHGGVEWVSRAVCNWPPS